MFEWCMAHPGYTCILAWVFIDSMGKVAKKCMESFDKAVEQDRLRAQLELKQLEAPLVMRAKLSDEAVSRIEEACKPKSGA